MRAACLYAALCVSLAMSVGASSYSISSTTSVIEELQEASRVVAAALRTMEQVTYRGAATGPHPATLISLDAHGYPSARTVVPRAVAPDLTFFRLHTRIGTRKVTEIGQNPKVSLNFVDPRGRGGWLTVKGDATVENDGKGGMNILFTSQLLEMVNYNEVGAMEDRDGWVPKILARNGKGWHVVSEEPRNEL
eukprot:TRINITY_DN25657_c0_g1_i1.p1 TRINITY_DN25657_c0_g1~~TRINITY_DN25657_c0_g1_i1.p1  ORF type:complete len:192 (+),score=23.71 TRINITY_DN25657_c0_g1_i1:67-642(+)